MGKTDQEKLAEFLAEYLKEHDVMPLGGNMSPEQMAQLGMQGQPRRQSAGATVEDYLEMAKAESDPRKAIDYVNKALKLEPDNLDAITLKIIKTPGRIDETLAKLAKAVEDGTAQMKKKGFIPQYVGNFWRTNGTRPYMRLLETFAGLLMSAGMIRRAMEMYEALFALNSVDNQGARYSLMQCYCLLEEWEKAMVLYGNSREKWLKEGVPIQDLNHYSNVPEFRKTLSRESKDAALVLPMAIMFYKLQDMEKAEHCMKILMNANEGTLKFFKMIQGLPEELPEKGEYSYGYRPFTINEYIAYYDQMRELMLGVPSFPAWALDQIKPKKH